MTAESYRDLGVYGDWVAFAGKRVPATSSDVRALTSAEVRTMLGFQGPADPLEPRIDGTWIRDGVRGEAISWSVGYGPRTQAWLLRPEASTGALPGVLALHDHSAFKFLGKEKIADGPDGEDPLVSDLRSVKYDGLAFANRLALRGFAVLVPDVFLWGSRRFPDDVVGLQTDIDPLHAADHAAAYNRSASLHEHIVEKYCVLLGTTLAGVVAHEDRVALRYLETRPEVKQGGIGCIGLSGGGCRAALLQATGDDIAIAVIVAMMSTYAELLDRHVAPHTWMFFPPGLARQADWPDLAACRAPSRLVVQYVLGDELFPDDGMRAAHERIAARYHAADAPDAYVGEFYEGTHSFTAVMQDAAFAHLEAWARAPASEQ